MIHKLFIRWQSLKAFNALYIVCGEYDQGSKEYNEIVTALDILRTKINP